MRIDRQVVALLPLLLLALLACGCSGANQPDATFAPTAPNPVAQTTASEALHVGLQAGAVKTGTGTGLITSVEILSNRIAGTNSIQDRRLTGTVEGTMQGSFVELVSGVVHGTGLVTFNGTLEFTGTVADCGEGTLTLGVSGQGQAGLPISDAAIRAINQAANTLSVEGTGTLHQEGPMITYEVNYVCK